MRNIAKPFHTTLSIIDINTVQPKYKCFYTEDVQLFIKVIDEFKKPFDISSTNIKAFFINNGDDLRQDDRITIANAENGEFNILVRKNYIRLGLNTVRVVLFDADQEVFLQPFQIHCISSEILDDSIIIADDDYNVRDEVSKVNSKIDTEVDKLESSLETKATNQWCIGGFWNVCHKGGVASCSPQNSIEGIEKAYNLGYKAIECDVVMSSDGEWVVFHDETVDYLTDGTGKIHEKTYAQIQELNYDQTTGGNKLFLETFYFPVKIPKFDDFLAKAKEYNMCVGLDVQTFKTYTELETKSLIDIIKKHGMEKRVVMWGVINDYVRKYSLDIALSTRHSSQTTADDTYNSIKKYLPNAIDNRIDNCYTKDIIQGLHQYGIKCMVGFPGNVEIDSNDIVEKWRDEYGIDYLVIDNYFINGGNI